MNLMVRVTENAQSAGGDYRFRHFVRWTPGISLAYRRVENAAFRRELRYSGSELRDRARRDGFEGLVLYDPKKPAAVMLVHRGPDTGSLYLDTLAVSRPGRGLGGRLLRALLGAAESAGFSRLEIDTEMINERGQELVSFYQRFGFQITSRDEESGNISMARQIRDSPLPLI